MSKKVKRAKDADDQSEPSDLELVALTLQADQYKPLFDRYVIKLSRFFNRYLHDQHEAEDQAMETMNKVYDKLHMYDEKLGSFRSWLYTMARRDCISRSRRPPKPEPSGDKMDMLEEVGVSATQGLRLDINMCISLLSPYEQALAELRYLQEMTIREIAMVMQSARETIQRHCRAIACKLQQCLEKHIE